MEDMDRKRARQNRWKQRKRRGPRGGEVRDGDRAHRARKAGARVLQVEADWEQDQLDRQGNRCHWCSKPIGMGQVKEGRTLRVDFDADHIVPLDEGGEHSASNMVLACIGCNTRRGGQQTNGNRLEPASQEDEVL